jgi:hypothetical protein
MALFFPLMLIALSGAPDAVVRLSPDAREQAIESAANPQKDPVAEAEHLQRDRRVHGELGFMIGTGGARGAYGVAEVPIGESGAAMFAFETERYPVRRRYR